MHFCDQSWPSHPADSVKRVKQNFSALQELRSLKDRIMDLKWKLPSDVRLSVELGQEFFQSTFLIATKIIGKEILVRFWLCHLLSILFIFRAP